MKPRRREPELFLNRELSWLEFDGRVLEEACDATNPLLERLKFACIAAGNLDEFFMVRVAALKNALAEGDTAPDLAGLTPAQQLQKISERAHAMVEQLYATLGGEILPAPRRAGVEAAPARGPRARGSRRARPSFPGRGAARPHAAGDRLLATLPDAGQPEPEPRGAARSRGGRGRAPPRRGPGARAPAAPRASARHRGPRPPAARGRDPRRAGRALPGPGDRRRRQLPHRSRRGAGPRRRGGLRPVGGDRGGAEEPAQEQRRAARGRGRSQRAAARPARLAAGGGPRGRLPDPRAARPAAARLARRAAGLRGPARRAAQAPARCRREGAAALSRCSTSATSCCTTPTSPSTRSWPWWTWPRTTPTCSRSSRPSTAPAAIRPSCARWRAPPRTASR